MSFEETLAVKETPASSMETASPSPPTRQSHQRPPLYLAETLALMDGGGTTQMILSEQGILTRNNIKDEGGCSNLMSSPWGDLNTSSINQTPTVINNLLATTVYPTNSSFPFHFQYHHPPPLDFRQQGALSMMPSTPHHPSPMVPGPNTPWGLSQTAPTQSDFYYEPYSQYQNMLLYMQQQQHAMIPSSNLIGGSIASSQSVSNPATSDVAGSNMSRVSSSPAESSSPSKGAKRSLSDSKKTRRDGDIKKKPAKKKVKANTLSHPDTSNTDTPKKDAISDINKTETPAKKEPLIPAVPLYPDVDFTELTLPQVKQYVQDNFDGSYEEAAASLLQIDDEQALLSLPLFTQENITAQNFSQNAKPVDLIRYLWWNFESPASTVSRQLEELKIAAVDDWNVFEALKAQYGLAQKSLAKLRKAMTSGMRQVGSVREPVHGLFGQQQVVSSDDLTTTDGLKSGSCNIVRRPMDGLMNEMKSVGLEITSTLRTNMKRIKGLSQVLIKSIENRQDRIATVRKLEEKRREGYAKITAQSVTKFWKMVDTLRKKKLLYEQRTELMKLKRVQQQELVDRASEYANRLTQRLKEREKLLTKYGIEYAAIADGGELSDQESSTSGDEEVHSDNETWAIQENQDQQYEDEMTDTSESSLSSDDVVIGSSANGDQGNQQRPSKGRKELQELREESELPLEQLMAKYGKAKSSVTNSSSSKADKLKQSGAARMREMRQARRQRRQQQSNSSSSSSSSDEEPHSRPLLPVSSLLRGKLRPYQHMGFDWLVTLHDTEINGILADEMGLGKTIQTIATLAYLASDRGIWGPHLIVVPTSVVVNWDIEFKKFAPGLKTICYHGSKKDREKKRLGWNRPFAFHVCITSYTVVLADAPVFKRKSWYYMILDEAQNIRNYHSMRWQTLLQFNTERRLLLTGTPLQNNLMELWSLMYHLMPGVFGSHDDWRMLFNDPLTSAIEQSTISDEAAMVQNLYKILRPFLLRRLKKDVEDQMPSKIEYTLRCPLSKRQRLIYDQLLSSGKLTTETEYLTLMNVMMQLRKVCNHPNMLEEAIVKTPIQIPDLRVSQIFPQKYCLWLDPIERFNFPANRLYRSLIRENHPIFNLATFEFDKQLLTHAEAEHSNFKSMPFEEEGEDDVKRQRRDLKSERRDAEGAVTGTKEPEANEETQTQKTEMATEIPAKHTRGGKVTQTTANIRPSPPSNDNFVMLKSNEYYCPTVMTQRSVLPSPYSHHPQGGLSIAPPRAPPPRGSSSRSVSPQLRAVPSISSKSPLLHPMVQGYPLPGMPLQPQSAPAGPLGTPVTPLYSGNISSAGSVVFCPFLSNLQSPYGPLAVRGLGQMPSLGQMMCYQRPPLPAPSPGASYNMYLQQQQQQQQPSTSGGDQQDNSRGAHQPSMLHRSDPSHFSEVPACVSSPSDEFVNRRKRKVKVEEVANNKRMHHDESDIQRPSLVSYIPFPFGMDMTSSVRCKRKFDETTTTLLDSDEFHYVYQSALRTLMREQVWRETAWEEMGLLTRWRRQNQRRRRDSTEVTTQPYVPEFQRGFSFLNPRRYYGPSVDCGISESDIGTSLDELTSLFFTDGDKALNFPTMLHRLVQLVETKDRRHQFFSGEYGLEDRLIDICLYPTVDEHVFPYEREKFMKLVSVRSNLVAPLGPDVSLIGFGGNEKERRSIENGLRLGDHVTSMIPKSISNWNRLSEAIFPRKESFILESGKLLVLSNLLEKQAQLKLKCVIFSQMARCLDVLEVFLNMKGYTYVRLDGGTKPENRHRIVEVFNKDPKVFVFISSTRAGGVGINLTGASVVIFFDTDWNPAMDRQAMDRCHRLGQTKDVSVYRLITENTIEENIWRKQLQKRQLDDIVVDQGKFVVSTADVLFTKNEVKDLLFSVQSANEDLYAVRVLHEPRTTMDTALMLAAEQATTGTTAEGDETLSVLQGDKIPKESSSREILQERREMEMALQSVEDNDDQSALVKTKVELKNQMSDFSNEFSACVGLPTPVSVEETSSARSSANVVPGVSGDLESHKEILLTKDELVSSVRMVITPQIQLDVAPVVEYALKYLEEQQ